MSNNYAKIVADNLIRLYGDLPKDLARALPGDQDRDRFVFEAFGERCEIRPDGILLGEVQQTGVIGILISLYALHARPEPQVNCQVTKEKVGVCGAFNPRDGRLLSLIFDGFDSDTFTYYLKWLIRKFKTRKKIVLVLDNASSHKSNKVTEFVEKHRKRLELLFLPPYSPELNPVERVWKNLRYRVTHNTFFENLTALENAVIEYLKEHAKPNKQLTSLCCIN